MNGLRNIGMLKNYWNELSKRTVDWGEIRITIEDQLTVQRNWNPNPDMTGLKESTDPEKITTWGKQDRSGWR